MANRIKLWEQYIKEMDPEVLSPDEEKHIEDEISKLFSKSIILFNDSVNTFDYVIECLIELCEIDFDKASKIAWTVHSKGKCPAKEGTYEELKPIAEELSKRGLTVEIQ